MQIDDLDEEQNAESLDFGKHGAESRKQVEEDQARIPLSDRTNVGIVDPKRVLSGSSQTSGSSVVAVQSPSIAGIRGWSTKQLIRHLQAKFSDDLDNEDLEIMQKEKIRGSAFLILTEEKLERYGMKGGPASVIAGYIDELKGTCNSSCFVLYILKSVSSNCFLQMSICRRRPEQLACAGCSRNHRSSKNDKSWTQVCFLRRFMCLI